MATAVVAAGSPGIGVAGGVLNVLKRHAGLPSSSNETFSNLPDVGSLVEVPPVTRSPDTPSAVQWVREAVLGLAPPALFKVTSHRVV